MSKTAKGQKPAPAPFSTADDLQKFAQVAAQKAAISREYEALKERAAVTLSNAPAVVETDPKTGKSRIIYQVEFSGWILKAVQSDRDAYTIPAGSTTRYTAKAL